MKLLYLSAHAILEYDELKMFETLGIEYFSLGSYIDPQNPVDKIRPALTQKRNDDLIAHAPLKNQLTKEFVDQFDVVLIMHVPEWVISNWEVIKHKRVIWRSIGQSTAEVEARLEPYRKEGLQVVRYSKMEINIHGNIGADSLIYFSKDKKEYSGWHGANAQMITIGQDLYNRGEFCNYDAIRSVFSQVKSSVYGTKNETIGGKYLDYEGMKQVLRDNRAFFYTGTQPASYTLSFIEAMMIGIPIIAIGNSYRKLSMEIAGDVYEIPNIIQQGVNGFIAENITDALKFANLLIENYSIAQRISEYGRQTAIELFDEKKITNLWRSFLC